MVEPLLFPRTCFVPDSYASLARRTIHPTPGTLGERSVLSLRGGLSLRGRRTRLPRAGRGRRWLRPLRMAALEQPPPEGSKPLSGLLGGIAQAAYYGNADITEELLRGQLYPEAAPEEFRALRTKMGGLLQVAARTGLWRGKRLSCGGPARGVKAISPASPPQRVRCPHTDERLPPLAAAGAAAGLDPAALSEGLSCAWRFWSALRRVKAARLAGGFALSGPSCGTGGSVRGRAVVGLSVRDSSEAGARTL